MNEIEDIIQSMIYISEQIELKQQEIQSLRSIYYKYKNYLIKKYPEEEIEQKEYKMILLKKENQDGSFNNI